MPSATKTLPAKTLPDLPLLVQRPGETQHRSHAWDGLLGGLAGATLLAGYSRIFEYPHATTAKMNTAWTLGYAAVGGVMGVFAGVASAKDHNLWADKLNELQQQDAHGDLVPEHFPAINPEYDQKRDAMHEGLRHGARTALFISLINGGFEALSHGKNVLEKMNYRYVIGEGLALGAITGAIQYDQAGKHNHRADVVDYFRKKAAHRAVDQKDITFEDDGEDRKSSRSFAEREETRTHASAGVGRT